MTTIHLIFDNTNLEMAGEAMVFDQTSSFEDNLAHFRAEVEQLDLECARILFDNIATLSRDGDAARSRQSIQEFHRAVLQSLDALPEANAS